MSGRSSTPTETRTAVRLEGLVKSFAKGVRALDGIELSVSRGELVALIGANGSGKSTLLKILFGIIEADRGTIEVLGLHPRRDRALLRSRAAYAGQDPALDNEMTGWETLRLFHALRALPHGDMEMRLGRLVEEHGLTSFCDRRVGGYSGGQRQRLHLAIEMMHEPDLLLLDEPTASLDPDGRRLLWRRLVDRRNRGNTAVIATHDLADASARADRVIVMNEGRVAADGHPDVLIAEHGRTRTVITLMRSLDDAHDIAGALRALPDVSDVGIDDTTITIWRERFPEGSEPALEILAAHDIIVRSFERQEPDLAGAYFRLTGSSLAPQAAPRRGQGPGRGQGRGQGQGGGRGMGRGS